MQVTAAFLTQCKHSHVQFMCALCSFTLQDQAPLQNRAPDWQLGSNGCYDAATLAALQKTLADNLEAVADGNAEGCLSLPLPDAAMQLLKQVLVLLCLQSLFASLRLEQHVQTQVHACGVSISSMHAHCSFAYRLIYAHLPGGCFACLFLIFAPINTAQILVITQL
jgi:hypothetical protein